MDCIQIDQGFLFGRSVFTTLKIRDGQAVFLDRHLQRLESSAQALSFKSLANREAVDNYIREKQLNHAALKILISPENLLLMDRSDPYGVNLPSPKYVVLSPIHRHSSNWLLQHKTTMYLANKLSLEQAHQQGAFECLFLNEREEICEGSFTNFFLIQGSDIYTPPLEAGILPGLMRQWILDHFPVQVCPIPWQERRTFQAAFVTNCLIGIGPIQQIEDTTYQNNHPLIHQIYHQYTQSVFH
ncbi:aminotransferase class IV [Facklamia sp. DSM 111018]|uniref:Aminotransferase class IV n=1 Tax=Facklamia lactis TaxID=2749967 RepID=A0ABS0LR59_9LACT|nr:aminotransferase class IV [Facklamia lactis]MBG9979557.1 aminotransferase class IV [Facklamia lactis]MBG9985774.1 aminotransferase class IV [Facklamia lactis]